MNYQFPSRKFVRESRPHDYIYDNSHSSSGKKDFLKSVSHGTRAGARLSLKPVYKSMFSDSKLDRRIEACLTIPQPSPLENFLPQYDISGFPVLPSEQEREEYSTPFDPTGADRAVYAIKYVPESFQTVRPKVRFDLQAEAHKRKGKSSVSHGVQTDYRESSTQTDPYSPQYQLPYAGAYPKVLALIKLTWGRGLPVTLDDIAVIESALAKRLDDIGNSDIESQENFEMRVKLVAKLEAEQWLKREQELTDIMTQKLEIVKRLLGDCKAKSLSDNFAKLERKCEIEEERNTKLVENVVHQHFRNLRKSKKATNSDNRSHKRDIMKEHLHYDSQVYAPLVRNGKNLDQLYKAPEFDYREYNNYAVFDELTNRRSFKEEFLECDIQAFSNRINSVQLTRKEKRMESTLDEICHTMRHESKKTKDKSDDAAMMKQMILNKMRALLTPEIEESPSDEDQNIISSIVQLQQVIRGRAVQSKIRDEIRSNMDTILNLKSLHKSDPYGVRTTWGERAVMNSLQAERDTQLEAQLSTTAISDQLQDETLTSMLDFLDREMVRLLDERKVHTLLLLAERERRMKEALEGGQRAKEEERRRTNDEIFRQVVGITQGTVDLYLKDMYLETINRGSDVDARDYVRDLAHTLNEAVYLDRNRTDEGKEELSAELVYGFMIPEIHRVMQNERMAGLGLRYKNVAAETVEATINAQGWLKDALESVWPTVEKHLANGEIASDGTKTAVDQFIKEAVEIILGQGEHFELIKENELEYRKTKKQKPEATVEFESEKSEVGDEDFHDKEKVSERSRARLSLAPPKYSEFYPARSTLEREMAEISLQTDRGTEIPYETLVFMDRTQRVTDDIFEQVLENLIPAQEIPTCDDEESSEDDEK